MAEVQRCRRAPASIGSDASASVMCVARSAVRSDSDSVPAPYPLWKCARSSPKKEREKPPTRLEVRARDG